jgi:hypothetical protein
VNFATAPSARRIKMHFEDLREWLRDLNNQNLVLHRNEVVTLLEEYDRVTRPDREKSDE